MTTVTVAYFKQNQAALDAMAGGFSIADTAANIQAADALAAMASDSHIAAIAATDTGVIVPVGSFTSYQAALDKVTGGFTVADVAAAVIGQISGLKTDANLAALTFTSGSASTSATFSIGSAKTLNLGTGTLTLNGSAVFPAGGTTPTLVTGSAGATLVTNGSTSLKAMTLTGSVVWQNNGSITAAGTGLTLNGSASSTPVFYNNGGGSFNIIGDFSINCYSTSPNDIDPSFVNRGVFEKIAGSGITMFNGSFAGASDAQGSIKVDSGTVEFLGSTNLLNQTIGGSGALILGYDNYSVFGPSSSVTIGPGTTITVDSLQLALVYATFNEDVTYNGLFEIDDSVLFLGNRTLSLGGANNFHGLSDHAVISASAGGKMITSATTDVYTFGVAGSATWVNSGTIECHAGNFMSFSDGGSLVNIGGGSIDLQAGYALIDLGGSPAASVLDNQGGSITFSAGDPSYQARIGVSVVNSSQAQGSVSIVEGTFVLGGRASDLAREKISGSGTLSFAAGGTTLVGSSTFVSTAAWTIVDFGTTMRLTGNVSYGGTFSMTDGSVIDLGGNTLSLAGDASFSLGASGTPTLTGRGALVASGDTSLGYLTVGGSALFRNAGTVEQTMTITLGDGSGGVARATNAPGKSWILQGDIGIDAGDALAVFNNGGATLQKASGAGTSGIGVNFTNLAGTAASVVVSSGILKFSGANNTFRADAISGDGTVAIGGGGANTIASGTTIATAAWSIAKVGTRVTLGENLTYGGTFSDTNLTTLDLGANTLSLTGRAAFLLGPAGAPIVTGSGKLIASGNEMIAGLTVGGSALLRNNGSVTQTGTITIGDASNGAARVTNALGRSWALSGDVGIVRGSTAAVFNTGGGALIKSAGAGTSVVGVDVVNLNANPGQIEVTTGTLEFAGTVSGLQDLYIDPGKAMQFDATVAVGSTLTYVGAGGTLTLNDAQDFKGSIAGFGAGMSLDLQSVVFNAGLTGIAYSGESAGGTLTASDGTHVAHLAMQGHYAFSSFHLASDGHGGSLVTYG